MFLATLLTLSLLVISSRYSEELENGLARTPPMGWLAWERFTCETDCANEPNNCINRKLFEDMASSLRADGYSDLGYKYVNIDDCWSKMERDEETSRLVADAQRFPGGIEHLAQFIHYLDLKLGIYGDCGTKTCAGYPAQLKNEDSLQDNYFEIDANLFAVWEIDSFKFDGCNIDTLKAESICPKFTDALRKTQRDILLTCEWPFYMMVDKHTQPNFTLASESCNIWRYYSDVEDSWTSILGIVDFTVKMQTTILKYHGPGHWFDPDQLVIGNFGLSLDQAISQMALWSIWSAPLFMSNDLRDIDPEMKAVLQNRHLIGVDQDQLGVFGMMVEEAEEGSIQVFVKPIENIRKGCPSFAVVYFNRKILGNKKLVSFKVRALLLKSAISVAAHRYAELYKDKTPGGTFDAATCRKRLMSAMTREPSPVNLLNQKGNQQATTPIEEQSIKYEVFDLVEGIQFPNLIDINSDLNLVVNPSGVRAVKLTEVE